MDEVTYLFIDGGYVQRIYRQAMEAVFNQPGELDVSLIVHQTRAFRTYYYDCPDDSARGSESTSEFEARRAVQEQFFARVRSLRGVHLQLGTLRGQRRRSQKEVDVLLAVDMLTHGFNRNMTKAVLLAGDLDFRPIVEALVRSGIFVEVWHDKGSIANELHWAADFGVQISWGWLWHWSSADFRSVCPVPAESLSHGPIINQVAYRAGNVSGQKVIIVHNSQLGGPFVLKFERSSGVVWMEHANAEVLKRYFDMMYGPTSWM